MNNEKGRQKKKFRFSKTEGTVKILCLFAAFLLWVYVMLVEEPDVSEVMEDIPVQIINSESLNEKGYSVIIEDISTVNVVYSGRRKDLNSSVREEFTVTADVSGLLSAIMNTYDKAVAELNRIVANDMDSALSSSVRQAIAGLEKAVDEANIENVRLAVQALEAATAEVQNDTVSEVVRTLNDSLKDSDTTTSVRLNVAVPGGCEFVSVSPSTIVVSIDEYVKGQFVPLEFELQNTSEKYEYNKDALRMYASSGGQSDGHSTSTIDAITISGPKSKVDLVKRAVLEIDMTGTTKLEDRVVPVKLVDEGGNVLTRATLGNVVLSSDFARVSMPIYLKETVPVRFQMEHGFLDNTDSVITYTPEEVTVICDPIYDGKKDLIHLINLDERTELTKEHISAHRYEATIPLTSTVDDNIRIEPGEITVTIDIDKRISYWELDVLELQSTGGIDVDCNILTESIDDVVICGPAELLTELRPSDIYAVVDLSGYTAEKHNGETFSKVVNIVIDSPHSKKLFVLGEYRMEFEIIGKAEEQ